MPLILYSPTICAHIIIVKLVYFRGSVADSLYAFFSGSNFLHLMFGMNL